MNFTVHFHKNYTSSGIGTAYTKVSVEIDGFGMFCVIRNKKTGKIQRQAYATGKYSTRNYIGLSRVGYFKGVDGLAWQGMDDADKRGIVECVNALPSSFKMFSKKYNGISNLSLRVLDYLKSLRQQFYLMNIDSFSSAQSDDAGNATTVGATGESTSKKWVEVSIASLSSNDLPSILKMISEGKNPEEGVEYKGDRYRLICDDGKWILRKLRVDSTCEGGNGLTANGRKQQKIAVIPAPPKPKRNTKRMAFMMNNENLTEFVNGCYYQFVKECGGGYIKILNDANEERTVSKSRVSIIDVYDQPPLEEVTA